MSWAHTVAFVARFTLRPFAIVNNTRPPTSMILVPFTICRLSPPADLPPANLPPAVLQHLPILSPADFTSEQSHHLPFQHLPIYHLPFFSTCGRRSHHGRTYEMTLPPRHPRNPLDLYLLFHRPIDRRYPRPDIIIGHDFSHCFRNDVSPYHHLMPACDRRPEQHLRHKALQTENHHPFPPVPGRLKACPGLASRPAMSPGKGTTCSS